MTFGREIWDRLGQGAAEGRRLWSDSRGSRGVERTLWVAATVLMAIPIFALMLVALLGAVALTVSAFVVTRIWLVLVRLGVVRPPRRFSAATWSPPRPGPSGARADGA